MITKKTKIPGTSLIKPVLVHDTWWHWDAPYAALGRSCARKVFAGTPNQGVPANQLPLVCMRHLSRLLGQSSVMPRQACYCSAGSTNWGTPCGGHSLRESAPAASHGVPGAARMSCAGHFPIGIFVGGEFIFFLVFPSFQVF